MAISLSITKSSNSNAAVVVKRRGNNSSSSLWKRKRPRVQFAPSIQVAKVKSVKNEDLWYNKDAYRSFRADLGQTIRAVHECRGDIRYLDPNQHCLVGLEDRITNDQIRYRKRKNQQHTYNILEMQYTQRCRGISDPDTISALAGETSRLSGYRALQRAAVAY